MARKINMADKVTQTLLSMAAQGYTAAQIAKAVNRDKSSISRRIKNLAKAGYLNAVPKGIVKELNATNKGVAVIARRVMNTATSNQTIRSHDIRIKLPLKDNIENPMVYLGTKGILPNAMGLRNVNAASFTIERHVIQLMRQSAVVILPDVEVPVDTPIPQLVALIYDKLEYVLNACEKRTGIRFKRPAKDFFTAQLISNENAFKNNEFAVASRDLGLPSLWVIEYDEVDGKPSIIIDTSHGNPELETVHKNHSLEDAELIQKRIGGFIKELKDGNIDQERAFVRQSINDIAYNLASHVDAIKELKVAAQNFNSITAAQQQLIDKQSKQIAELISLLKDTHTRTDGSSM